MFSAASRDCSSSPPMESSPAEGGAAAKAAAKAAAGGKQAIHQRRLGQALEKGTPVTAVAPPPPPCSGGLNYGGAAGPAISSAAEQPRKIGAYAVQCTRCFKLRLIPTQEEYEAIRHNFTEDPWVCSRKPSVSCGDPADLEFDDTSLWVVDKPNIPKTPAGCKRILTMRKDFTKLDAAYVMPNGKRIRSLRDVEKFLEAYPKYKGQFAVPNFRFTVPKVMEGMFPGMYRGKGSKSTRRRKNNSKMDQTC